MVKEGNGEDSAEDTEGEHDTDRFEYPARINELNHLVWFWGSAASARVKAGLQAGCFGLGHGASVMCLASHAG